MMIAMAIFGWLLVLWVIEKRIEKIIISHIRPSVELNISQRSLRNTNFPTERTSAKRQLLVTREICRRNEENVARTVKEYSVNLDIFLGSNYKKLLSIYETKNCMSTILGTFSSRNIAEIYWKIH